MTHLANKDMEQIRGRINLNIDNFNNSNQSTYANPEKLRNLYG
jgi:hypothetical protein